MLSVLVVFVLCTGVLRPARLMYIVIWYFILQQRMGCMILTAISYIHRSKFLKLQLLFNNLSSHYQWHISNTARHVVFGISGTSRKTSRLLIGTCFHVALSPSTPFSNLTTVDAGQRHGVDRRSLQGVEGRGVGWGFTLKRLRELRCVLLKPGGLIFPLLSTRSSATTPCLPRWYYSDDDDSNLERGGGGGEKDGCFGKMKGCR